MAIINFSFDHDAANYAEGAYSPLVNTYEEERRIILWETYKGLCIKEREYNGSWDSDFYMTVWDVEKAEPKEICFASTRGWSYPSYGSYVDATPEIMEQYKAWKTARDRECRIKRKWHCRCEENAMAHVAGLTRKQIQQLKNCLTEDEFLAVYKLLKTRKFRSKFRASCAEQVRKWLLADNPLYKTPLSRKQLSYL